MQKPSCVPSLRILVFLVSCTGIAVQADTSAASAKGSAPSDSRRLQTEALRQEISVLQTEIHRERKESTNHNAPSSDTEIAARALKIERMLAARRALMKISREEDTPAKRAERHELQNRLAATSSPEERQVIIDQHIALQQALAMEPKSAAAAK